MSANRPRPRRRRPVRTVVRALLVAAAFTCVFGLGVALGRATRDNPTAGRTVTSVRTLRPVPPAPLARTVTVTVDEPNSD